MSTTDQFLLALKAYQDIQAELHPEKNIQPPTSDTPIPDLSVDYSSVIPAGSILLGLAEDGLPLLLDLYDPTPGPLLVAGDGGSGKTAVLHSLARASGLQDPGDIQFGVITLFPEEWTALEGMPNGLGIWPAYHSSAQNFLSQLVYWAEALPETHQTILLLIDGLDLLEGNGFQSRQDLRWLLMYGPERQIWPVVSVNPSRLSHRETWLEYFHSRIIGQVKHAHNARLLLGDRDINLADLMPGKQFGLSQPDSWLKFLLPPLA
jgi:hypothetical protein